VLNFGDSLEVIRVAGKEDSTVGQADALKLRMRPVVGREAVDVA
jgi:hypothetical protein